MTPVKTQPLAITGPTTDVETESAAETTTNQQKLKIRHRPWQNVAHIAHHIMRAMHIAVILVYRFSLIVTGSIFVVVLSSLILAINFGSTALQGVFCMLIGNGILRAAHLSHYTHNSSAAQIGAVGGIIGAIVLGLLLSFVHFGDGNNDKEQRAPGWVTLLVSVVHGTLSGTIGCAVLLHNHVDLGGMDVLHATRAGALGGAILGPGSIFIIPIIFAALAVILSPMWLLLFSGVEWFYGHSTETITPDSHSYSMCVCYGTCGRDPEVVERVEELRTIKQRATMFRGSM